MRSKNAFLTCILGQEDYQTIYQCNGTLRIKVYCLADTLPGLRKVYDYYTRLNGRTYAFEILYDGQPNTNVVMEGIKWFARQLKDN
jgi:hypothetical protein